jgi:hypothetical protein
MMERARCAITYDALNVNKNPSKLEEGSLHCSDTILRPVGGVKTATAVLKVSGCG